MTEQTKYNVPDDFDEIDRLNYSLEFVQKSHADSLRELQANEGQLLDKTLFREKRKAIAEAHEQASNAILQQIQDKTAETRRNLALNLRYEGTTAQEKENWQEAIRLVEGADTVEKQENLINRALRWGDRELARALVWKFGGQENYKGMHEALSQVDDRVRATWDFERSHGSYKKKGPSSQAWAGWQTYQGRGVLPDIPGRAPEDQPNYKREQRRAKFEQDHSIKK